MAYEARRNTSQEWSPGTARVEPIVDSPKPMWILKARRGRRHYVEIAGGPLHTRTIGEIAADQLNRLDPIHWDRFLIHQLPRILEIAS